VSVPKHLDHVLRCTDWALLSQQKLALLAVLRSRPDPEPLDGLLHWIDAMQDAAERCGYPVVWLESEQE
jgi:hypothetical protein